jgi:hypothetical protein
LLIIPFPFRKQPGAPRITSAKIEVTTGSKLELTVVGRELNPDPDEKPVVQIFGPQMSCVESSMTISGACLPTRL